MEIGNFDYYKGELEYARARIVEHRHHIEHLEERCHGLDQESKQYVPGQFRCAKCKLSLTAQTIYMKSGTIRDNNEPQECSNGCGPMWKITWEQYSKELMTTICNMVDRIQDLEKKIAR